MTDPRPCCFRWARRTIILACLAIVLTATPRALGQAPAAPKPSRSSTANRQERLKDRDRLAKEVEQLKTHGKLLDAIKAVEAMRTIESEVLGETSEDAIGSLEILAKLHQDREDWAEAKKAWSEVLELREKTLGKDHWKVTDARWALADVESLSKMDAAKRRRLAEAEKLDQKVEELFGQGKYSEAMKMAREVATIRKEIQGERHPDHAQSLNNLALLLATQGGYAAARPLYEQALAIHKAALGERHPDYALSLNNLAELLESQGDYAAARPLFEQALAIKKAVLGERHPSYALSLNNLAELFVSQGDYAAARPLLEQALAIKKAVLGERHPSYALSLNNLAALFVSQGDYAAARPLLEQALAIKKAVLGERHPDYLLSLNNLAAVLQHQGDLAGARPLFERASTLWKEVLGEHHLSYANGLNNVANLYLVQGDLAGARPLFEQALAIRKEVLGERHLDCARGLEQLAKLAQAQGDITQARQLVEQALDLSQEFLTRTLPTLPERQRIELLNQVQSTLALSLSLTRGSIELDPAVYHHLLFWKGLAGADIAARRLSTAPPEIYAKRLELNQVRAQLNSLTYAKVPPERRAQHDRQLTELREKRERLETELVRASGWKPDAPQPAEVAGALPRDAVLVDLFRYTHISPTSTGKGPFRREGRYIAFVVRKGKPPHRIELGPAADIDRAIDAWRDEPRNDAAHPVSRRLAQMVWQPLAAELDDAQLVLVAPDGQFNFLPWGALPDLTKPDAYLIERLTFAAVGSGRQVVELARRPFQPAPDRLLAVGGVDYNHRAAAGAPELAAQPTSADTIIVAATRTTRAAVFAGDKPPSFSKLSGTLPEVNAIAGLFGRATGGPAKVVSGTEASKEQVRKMLPGHRYIHLATHGYFAPESVKAADPFNLDALSLESAGRMGQGEVRGFYPGLVAGLAWAGANVPAKDPITGALDIGSGVMTAEEVEGLDLTGCELAVLSACDTGRGKVAGGQGVMGLQRAFHQAGVRTVVANLWLADDAAARKLMTLFYANLWGEKHLPPAEAMRQAQLAMLNEAVGIGALPRFWAGWVLSGDPGAGQSGR